MRLTRVALLGLVALAAVPGTAAAGGAALEAPTPARAWTARVLARAIARAVPSPGGRPVTAVLPTTAQASPTRLLVTGARTVAGRRWVRVLLPVRPNGTQGWLPAEPLRFNETRLRILIDQSELRLTLFRADRPVLSVPVAVGKPATPSPNGRFAVQELLRTRTPGAFLGPVVLPLTGFSETLNEYDGGNGRVAIHGTSLPALIGTRASHGCIRLQNRWIVALSRVVRGGTPVEIRP